MGKQWKQCQTLFLGGSKITAGCNCSHEIKKRLLLGRKAMTNLDNILKSEGFTLPKKFCLVRAMVVPAVMYVCAGNRLKTFHSWQRSWGRRLGIRKGGIEPRKFPRIFSSIYPPKPESAYFIALCSHLFLYWRLSPTTISLSLSKS